MCFMLFWLPEYFCEPKMAASKYHTKRVCGTTEVPGAKVPNRNRPEATELFLVYCIRKWLHCPELLLPKFSVQANIDLRQ